MGYTWTPGDALSATNLNKMNAATEDAINALKNGAVAHNAHNISELYAQMYIDGKSPDSLGMFFDTFSDENKINTFVNTGIENQKIKFMASYNLASATLKDNNVLTQKSIFVTNDGKYAFIGYYTNREIKKYELATPYDLTTATLTQTATMPGTSTYDNADGLWISDDGTKLIMVTSYSNSSNPSRFRQYTMSTPFDLATMTLSTTVDMYSTGGTGNKNVRSFRFNGDGTKIYAMSNYNDRDIYEYRLTTPYDISTISFYTSWSNYIPSGYDTIHLDFNDDGTKMYVLAENSSSYYVYVLEYDLPTAYEMGGGTLNTTHSFHSSYRYASTIQVLPQHLYIAHNGSYYCFRYDISGTNNTDSTGSATSITTTFQQDLRSARLWITRNSTAKYNLSSASGSTITIDADKTAQLNTSDTIDIFTSDNMSRERRTITAIDYNITNTGKTTITLNSALTGTYGTSDFIERVDVLPELSLVDKGDAESFQELEYVRSTIIGSETEDEYKLTVNNAGHDLVAKIHLTRNDTSLQPYAKMLAVTLTP